MGFQILAFLLVRPPRPTPANHCFLDTGTASTLRKIGQTKFFDVQSTVVQDLMHVQPSQVSMFVCQMNCGSTVVLPLTPISL